MANICEINIYIPLDKVPDEKERQQLTALYAAKSKWREAVKTDDELRIWKNEEAYIASQPGIPLKRTQWKYNFTDKEVKEGLVKNGQLKPDDEQWDHPTIGAYFHKRNNKTWVFPYTFGRGEGLLFDELDGITITRPEHVFTSPFIPMQWEFKWSFPWWAQIGFAGGKKNYDKGGKDAPKGKTKKFYKKWYEGHEQPFPYLIWELSVSEIIKNLDYAIKAYETFPVNGLSWQWGWVWKELDQLTKIYLWFKKIYQFVPDATACLDWGEVAWNMMSYEGVRKNDDPNQIMASVKEMNEDIKKLAGDNLSLKEFKKKYATEIRKSEKDYKGYVPIIKRSPFD